MTSNASKAGSKKDQFVGNAKDTLGGTVGNNSMQSEDKAQNASGSLEERIATVKCYVSVGDNSSEASAKVTKKKGGEAQKDWNS
ncbi:hypothetical protein INT46_011624 [Mucor plumbeus]|uniref:Uncharacterized protein n=1 Tax=Mucor plumbeus TaxID=97098 RepID=A0A8H7V7A7_9FUNG|nr:hypothetical protein INT46_011624 [Mucor plumbeus]